jgi:hypothetical protein
VGRSSNNVKKAKIRECWTFELIARRVDVEKNRITQMQAVTFVKKSEFSTPPECARAARHGGRSRK